MRVRARAGAPAFRGRTWACGFRRRAGALAFCAVSIAAFAAPSPAAAVNPLKPLCKASGAVSSAAGKICSLAQHGDRLAQASKKLAGGHVGGAVKAVLGAASSPVGAAAAAAVGFAAIVTSATGGAAFALRETGKLVDATTTPALRSAWFSSVYWRIAAIALLLTLPFLFAAAIQALLRSDLTLLLRAAFGYLPLAMLAVAVAGQLTAMLLAATDELSAGVSSVAGDAASHFLSRAASAIVALGLRTGSPFLAFLIGVFTVAGAVLLWVELMMRAAAVYVIVAMLPLAFAALVWPARRVWALRAVELLVALILSKLAIVTVLTLGGAALTSITLAGFLAGLVLLLLGAFAPWAMLRLIPVAELASGAVGRLRGEAGVADAGAMLAHGVAESAHGWASETTAEMRREAQGGADGAGAEAGRLRELSAGGGADSPGRGTGSGDGRPDPGDGGLDPGDGEPDPGDEPLGASDPIGADAPPAAGDLADASALGEAAAASEATDAGTARRRPDTSAASRNRVAAPPDAGATGPDAVPPPPHVPLPAETPEGTERSPGLDEMWQADDFSRTPIQLGPQEWPPRPWPAPGEDAKAAGDTQPAADETEPR